MMKLEQSMPMRPTATRIGAANASAMTVNCMISQEHNTENTRKSFSIEHVERIKTAQYKESKKKSKEYLDVGRGTWGGGRGKKKEER